MQVDAPWLVAAFFVGVVMAKWIRWSANTGRGNDALLAAVRLGMEQGIEAACKAMDDCVKVSQMHPWTAADMKVVIRAAMPKGSER